MPIAEPRPADLIGPAATAHPGIGQAERGDDQQPAGDGDGAEDEARAIHAAADAAPQSMGSEILPEPEAAHLQHVADHRHGARQGAQADHRIGAPDQIHAHQDPRQDRNRHRGTDQEPHQRLGRAAVIFHALATQGQVAPHERAEIGQSPKAVGAQRERGQRPPFQHQQKQWQTGRFEAGRRGCPTPSHLRADKRRPRHPTAPARSSRRVPSM